MTKGSNCLSYFRKYISEIKRSSSLQSDTWSPLAGYVTRVLESIAW
jgi:hypothetical protein